MSFGIDRAAFERLVLDHLSAAQRFAIRLTGQPDAAEEVMQEALVRVARSWQTFRGQSKFQTWFFQVVVNAFRDWMARRPENAELPPELHDRRQVSPPAAAMASEMEMLVASAVSSLPPRQREVLVMSAYEEMSPNEIAGILEISEQNVRTNLHLARQRLRQQLSSYLTEQSHEQ